MAGLEGYRDFATSLDDGEEYWDVTPAMALQATIKEMESWPDVWVGNMTTGELLGSSLFSLMGHIARFVEDGHVVKVWKIKMPTGITDG